MTNGLFLEDKPPFLSVKDWFAELMISNPEYFEKLRFIYEFWLPAFRLGFKVSEEVREK